MPQFPKRPKNAGPPLTPEQEAILGEPEAVQALSPPEEPTPGPEDTWNRSTPVVPHEAIQEPAPAAQRAKKWRVVADGRASWYGQLVNLTKGDVLDEGSYGTDGINRIRESVQLEEVT